MSDRSGPSFNSFDIAVSGTNNGQDFRSIYVGVSGDVVVMQESGPRTFKGMAGGVVHPIGGMYVTTGTTATDMVGLK